MKCERSEPGQAVARRVQRNHPSWRIVLILVCALTLNACNLRELVSPNKNAAPTATQPEGGSPTPAAATPLTAGPQTVPVQTLGAVNSLIWSQDGIVLGTESGLALIPTTPGGAQAQTATRPQQVQTGAPVLLTGAQSAPVIGWVSGDQTIYTLKLSAAGGSPGSPPVASAPTLETNSNIPVTGLAVSPNGEAIAYATFDGSLTVIPSGGQPSAQAVQSFKMPAWLSSLAFSPDGKTIGGADLPDFTVYLVDATTGKVQNTLEWVGSPTSALYFVAFSPDWSRVAWAAQSTVQIMPATGGDNGPLLNHEDAVNAAVWSPDGSRLATASAATVGGSLVPAVLIWNANTGSLLKTLPQTGAVKSLAFSPDGSQIAVLDNDGNLQVWNINQ